MKHIVFENEGELDLRMLNNFGVNVKEKDNAIGFFGTGMKYAIAVAKRIGAGMLVQSGSVEYTIGIKKDDFRGVSFNVITLGDAPLSFTTELGKKWEPWMAFRELYCNALDENGRMFTATDIPPPSPGITRFIVSHQEFLDVYAKRDLYFLNSKCLVKGDSVSIHENTGNPLFYKGVFVGKIGTKNDAHYSYNIEDAMDLTEDRTAKHPWAITYTLGKELIKLTDKNILRKILAPGRGSFEWDIEYGGAGNASVEWKEIMSELVMRKIGDVVPSALRKYQAYIGEEEPISARLNAVEEKILGRAMLFVEDMGYSVDWPVVVAENLGENVLGVARNNKIYIAHRTFQAGTKCVAGTLLEEICHLKYGYEDCSRSFQNYLIDQVISLRELVVGEPL